MSASGRDCGPMRIATRWGNFAKRDLISTGLWERVCRPATDKLSKKRPKVGNQESK